MHLTLLESGRSFLQTAECAVLSIVAHAAVTWFAVSATDDGLKLPVNEHKSRVAPIDECVFLGFSFCKGKLRWSDAAFADFQHRIRELTGRTLGVGVPQLIAPLARYLIGWRGYFGFCQTPIVLHNLDAWIRRRLRMYIWRQWKNGRTRYAHLRRLGVSRHVTVQQALPNAFFDSLGLPRLEAPPTA